MSQPELGFDDLKQMIADGKVTVVVGAGVSYATTSKAPTWLKLIENGIDRCAKLEEPEEGSVRVFRGGSWGSSAWNCRSAIRFRYSPSYRYNGLGFRVATVPGTGPVSK